MYVNSVRHRMVRGDANVDYGSKSIKLIPGTTRHFTLQFEENCAETYSIIPLQGQISN